MPSNCRRPQTDYQLDDDVNEEYYSLLCDVGIGGILQREDRSKLQFYLDTTVLTVPSIRIGAYVWSASNERNFVDNRQMLDVAVEERSAIEIVGYVAVVWELNGFHIVHNINIYHISKQTKY